MLLEQIAFSWPRYPITTAPSTGNMLEPWRVDIYMPSRIRIRRVCVCVCVFVCVYIYIYISVSRSVKDDLIRGSVPCGSTADGCLFAACPANPRRSFLPFLFSSLKKRGRTKVTSPYIPNAKAFSVPHGESWIPTGVFKLTKGFYL